MSVKDHIKGNSVFLFYRKGFLHYKTDDTNFEFRVPIEDAGDAAFLNTDRSMIMMRYIRKELEQQKNEE